MIVYAEREQRVRAAALLSEIKALPAGEERLIRFGQWEAAVLDAHCPEVDDGADALRLPVPEFVSIRPQEGFAYYALYPCQYEAAATRFAREQRPSSTVVIGIRSIGTTLSTVVSRSIGCPVWRFTVRPRGHPFDRRVRFSAELADRIRQRSSDWFLIVDEGPGLSGSSFHSVASALNEAGVADSRIVFFPSHDADPSRLVCGAARARWLRHRKYIEPFCAARHVPEGARDLSGGKWREVTGLRVAAQPQHERRKYLHEGVLWKFAGLAHYGRARLRRSIELMDAGFGPIVEGFADGFLRMRWQDGGRRRGAPPAQFLARYLAHIANCYQTTESVDYDALAAMIETNTGLAMPSCRPLISAQRAVAIDARMLPHEFLGDNDGRWLKTDAVDHHNDHFLPGCQDIAWDIAAAAFEFGVAPDELIAKYLPYRRETHLYERVDFYTLAYLAFRRGYCAMAVASLGDSPDGRRFAALERRYTAALVGRTPRPASSTA